MMVRSHPKVTRMHALAIMDPRHDLLIADDGELVVASSSRLPTSGRIILARGDLLDHGIALAGGGARFASGSASRIDYLLDTINHGC